MEEYVQQLLADLNAARRTGKTVNKQSFTSLEDALEEMDFYFGLPDSQVLHEILGISPAFFPPVDRLSLQQIGKINACFEKCLHSWNIIVDLPKSFPSDMKYRLLISTLSRKVEILRFGYVHIEFCEQNVEKCPLGPSYCSCLHYFKDLSYQFLDTEEEDEWF